MKTPLNSKVLILSLSALVLIGSSGCERRGRAPVKASGTTATDVTTDSSGKTIPIVDANPDGKSLPIVPEKPSTTVETNEVALQLDAKMECKAPAIDVNATAFVSAAKDGKYEAGSFQADLVLITDYTNCIGQTAGLALVADGEKENKTWSISSDLARKEFAKLANLKDADSDTALKIMKSRLEFSVLQFAKMTTKYNAERLRSSSINADADMQFAQNTISVSSTSLDLQKVTDALIASRPQIAGLSIYKDGIDQSEIVSESL